MPLVGPVEILIFLVVGAALVFLVFRGRVPWPALALIVIVLSPPVAATLAFIVGAFANALAPA